MKREVLRALSADALRRMPGTKAYVYAVFFTMICLFGSTTASQGKSANPLSSELLEQIGLTVQEHYRGQAKGTVIVLVKRFNVSDKETYALVERLNDFFVVDLIKDRQKGMITDVFISKDLRINRVRQDLVELVRRDPIIFVLCLPNN